jgi:hypothetical protein
MFIELVVFYLFAGFEVLTAVVMKGSVFWDKTPCSPLKVKRRFGGKCRLHLQGRRISQPRRQYEAGTKHFQRTTRNYIPEDRTLKFICGLLKDNVSNSEYIAPNCGWERIGKTVEISDRGLILGIGPLFAWRYREIP